jgi:hypothetical protein
MLARFAHSIPNLKERAPPKAARVSPLCFPLARLRAGILPARIRFRI